MTIEQITRNDQDEAMNICCKVSHLHNGVNRMTTEISAPHHRNIRGQGQGKHRLIGVEVGVDDGDDDECML